MKTQLVQLKAMLVEAGLEVKEGRLRDVYTWVDPEDPGFQEKCLIVKNYAVTWSKSQFYDVDGYITKASLEQEPDINRVVSFLKAQ